MTCGWSTRPRSSVGARETAKRSDPAGWAEYRLLRFAFALLLGAALHLVCTLSGLPDGVRAGRAPRPTNATVLLGMLDADPNLVGRPPESKLMADRNYYGKAFEGALADAEVELLRPARKGEKPRPGHRYFKPFRQAIESIDDTLKTQLDLERHGGRTIAACVAEYSTHPRPHRRDLAQRPTRPAHAAIANRLRPLTPWNYSSSAVLNDRKGAREPPATRRRIGRTRWFRVRTSRSGPEPWARQCSRRW